MTDTHPDATPLRIALVVASVRTGRVADALLPWLTGRLAARPWLDLDVIDLRDESIDPAALRPGGGGPLSDRVGRADGFVVLTPEYNHSFPAPLKALLDAHHAEWARKPATFVSYGAASGGLRAVEQLRPVFSELQATTTRNTVALVAPWDRLDVGGFRASAGEQAALDATLEELRWWAEALRAARLADAVPA